MGNETINIEIWSTEDTKTRRSHGSSPRGSSEVKRMKEIGACFHVAQRLQVRGSPPLLITLSIIRSFYRQPSLLSSTSSKLCITFSMFLAHWIMGNR